MTVLAVTEKGEYIDKTYSEVEDYRPQRFVSADRSIGYSWGLAGSTLSDVSGNELSPWDLVSHTRRFYARDAQDQYDLHWPRENPIPCKRMTAPKSHFS